MIGSVEAAVAEALGRIDGPPLLAVSGGRDSMAMLAAAAASEIKGAVVAHVDHGVRDNSSQDVTFVESQSKRYGLAFETRKISPASTSEESLRRSRYDALRQIAVCRGLKWVALGHSADDQAETVLFRILRGTGVPGLSGMPVSRPIGGGVSLIRPLLSVTRSDITQYLSERDVGYLDDPTNETSDYSRNWLRNDLLPLIRSRLNCSVSDALARLASSATEYASFAESAAKAVLQDASRDDGRLDCEALRSAPDLIRREALRLFWADRGWPMQEMSYDRWCDAAAVISPDGPVGVDLPGGVSVRRSKGLLTLNRSG